MARCSVGHQVLNSRFWALKTSHWMTTQRPPGHTDVLAGCPRALSWRNISHMITISPRYEFNEASGHHIFVTLPGYFEPVAKRQKVWAFGLWSCRRHVSMWRRQAVSRRELNQLELRKADVLAPGLGGCPIAWRGHRNDAEVARTKETLRHYVWDNVAQTSTHDFSSTKGHAFGRSLQLLTTNSLGRFVKRCFLK